MNSMSRITTVVFLATSGLATGAPSVNTIQKLTTASGHRMMVRLTEQMVIVNQRSGVLGCVSDEPGDCARVTTMDITVDKRPVFVPLSAFCDIGNVRILNTTIGRDGAKIRIEGGDASEGYVADIFLNGDRVVARYIYSGLDKTQYIQKTTYRILTLE